MDVILDFIMQLIQKWPALGSILALVGAFRIVLKPLEALIESIILATTTKSDDQWLVTFKQGKVYWFLNWLLSLKIPEGKALVSKPK